MKYTTYYLLICCMMIFGRADAQVNIYEFDNYKFRKDSDYKAAEPLVSEVVSLLLSIPIDRDEHDREEAIDFLYNWMVGTPDYVFGTGRIKIILQDDFQLMGICFAAQIKYALEHKKSVKNNPEAIYDVWATIAGYVGKKENNVYLNSKLRELVAAHRSGNLADFIKKHQ